MIGSFPDQIYMGQIFVEGYSFKKVVIFFERWGLSVDKFFTLEV